MTQIVIDTHPQYESGTGETIKLLDVVSGRGLYNRVRQNVLLYELNKYLQLSFAQDRWGPSVEFVKVTITDLVTNTVLYILDMGEKVLYSGGYAQFRLELSYDGILASWKVSSVGRAGGEVSVSMTTAMVYVAVYVEQGYMYAVSADNGSVLSPAGYLDVDVVLPVIFDSYIHQQGLAAAPNSVATIYGSGLDGAGVLTVRSSNMITWAGDFDYAKITLYEGALSSEKTQLQVTASAAGYAVVGQTIPWSEVSRLATTLELWNDNTNTGVPVSFTEVVSFPVQTTTDDENATDFDDGGDFDTYYGYGDPDGPTTVTRYPPVTGGVPDDATISNQFTTSPPMTEEQIDAGTSDASWRIFLKWLNQWDFKETRRRKAEYKQAERNLAEQRDIGLHLLGIQIEIELFKDYFVETFNNLDGFPAEFDPSDIRAVNFWKLIHLAGIVHLEFPLQDIRGLADVIGKLVAGRTCAP